MTEREFINYWKNTDFLTYNEIDVREDFIAPLLKVLGYSKNTVNNIVREKTLGLTEPFQRLGRQRVQIDYMPTIRLKSFWILEAKPGNIKEMDVGDLLQAYLYATHPEIQAQYIVLCNGHSLMIFDVYQIENWCEPVFEITQNDCQDKFLELKEILSVKTMLEYRRKRLLQQIQDTFEVELDVGHWNSFVNEINKRKHPIEKKIKENVREFQRSDFEKNRKQKRQALQNADDATVLGWMALSGPRTAELYLEYYSRIKKADTVKRAELLRKLMQRYWGRCHAEYKCDCLAILFLIVKEKLEIAKNPFLNEPEAILCEIIKGNLTYHRDNTMQNALDYLDKICCKFSYLLLLNSSMSIMSERVDAIRSSMAIEELLVERPSVAREMVKLINICTDYLWMYLSNVTSEQGIWVNIRVLDIFIQSLNDRELPKYPDDDDDLLQYNLYGDKDDYLFRVSYMIINQYKSVVKNLSLDSEVLAIIFSDREVAMKFMPQMPTLEEPLQEDEVKNTMSKIAVALMKTEECWRDINKNE